MRQTPRWPCETLSAGIIAFAVIYTYGCTGANARPHGLLCRSMWPSVSALADLNQLPDSMYSPGFPVLEIKRSGAAGLKSEKAQKTTSL